jgi:hypothetical protein
MIAPGYEQYATYIKDRNNPSKEGTMQDALGNNVIIGNTYGYSAKDTVFVGIVTHFTKTRVTLETINRRFFRYGEEDTKWGGESHPPVKTTSVPSFHLFPVNI